ncbi:hypothetical protein [Nonomuraea salmonea]|uniref:Uncharacterized protein n=1 Tax=Nonomuraea salmonea TaxID=46181 RepID=A0ABV5P2Y7_9ACTN
MDEAVPDEPSPERWARTRRKHRRVLEVEALLEVLRSDLYGEIKGLLRDLPVRGGRPRVVKELGLDGSTRQYTWVRWIDQLDLASRERRMEDQRAEMGVAVEQIEALKRLLGYDD